MHGARRMLFGIDTFGEVDPASASSPAGYDAAIREILDLAILAEDVGIDSFGVGEHHRADFCVSVPEILLAAVASRTCRIRLSSAVTVLGADDPIRVYERFATLSALSHGRTEIVVGRGAFIEAFPLFGLSLDAYDDLFSEKLDILRDLCRRGRADWRGTHRSPLADIRVFPIPSALPQLSVAAASGASILRAAKLGLPLVLPVLRGEPCRYRAHVDTFRSVARNADGPVTVSLHSPGHIAGTNDEARERYWHAAGRNVERLSLERGVPALSKEEYLEEVERGSLYVGDADTVAHKIFDSVRQLDVDVFRLKFSAPGLASRHVCESIRLFGTKVIPKVREMLAC